MRLHVLVEGSSEVKLLEGLLPRLIPGHDFAIYPHQGKGTLRDRPKSTQRGVLDQLANKLRAWGKSFSPETDRVVLLVDLDKGDCKELLASLDAMLATIKPAPACLFRIAIEEVEAWYLGDWAALKRAFPRAKKAALEDYEPDSICGTWETLQQVIGDPVDRKIFWAEAIGRELDVAKGGHANRSPSFRKFCEGVQRLVEEDPSALRAKRQGVSPGAGRTAKKGREKR